MWHKLNHISESQHTDPISPSRPSYGVYIVSVLDRIDRVITALRCTNTRVTGRPHVKGPGQTNDRSWFSCITSFKLLLQANDRKRSPGATESTSGDGSHAKKPEDAPFHPVSDGRSDVASVSYWQTLHHTKPLRLHTVQSGRQGPRGSPRTRTR